MSKRTSEQIFNQIKRQMTQRGYKNHFMAVYVQKIAKEVMNSNRDNLKPQLKYKDEVKYAIADKIVRNFFQKNSNLVLTQETIDLENPNPFSFKSDNNLLQIVKRQGYNGFSELLDWNYFRVNTIRKQQEAIERQKQEELQRIADEEQRRLEEERRLHEEEEEALEQERQARSVAGSWRSGLGVRFVTRMPQSLLPEGARSPPPSARAKSPPNRSVIVYNLNQEGRSNFDPANRRRFEAGSVVSAPVRNDYQNDNANNRNTKRKVAQSTRPVKSNQNQDNKKRPSALQTNVTPNGSSASTPLN